MMAHQLGERDAQKLGIPRKTMQTIDLEPEAGRAWLRYQTTLRILGNSVDCVSKWARVDGAKVLRVKVDPYSVDLFRQCVDADPKTDIATKALILDKIGGRL